MLTCFTGYLSTLLREYCGASPPRETYRVHVSIRGSCEAIEHLARELCFKELLDTLRILSRYVVDCCYSLEGNYAWGSAVFETPRGRLDVDVEVELSPFMTILVSTFKPLIGRHCRSCMESGQEQ